MTRYANLAVAATLAMLAARGAAVGPDDPPTPPPGQPATHGENESPAQAFEPVRVRFKLADGVQIAGRLTYWDEDGIDGSFGQRAWTDIDYQDVWILYRRLMDQESASDWVDLGRTLSIVAFDQPRAERYAERAFRGALRRDGQAEKMIAEARDEVAAERRLRTEAEAAAEAARLATDDPEGRAWKPTPWPVLTEEEQAAAVRTMRADAAKILERAGMQIAPVETDYFLFYSDMSRKESAKWAAELDLMYGKLAARFDLPAGENIFWGKAVIFVFSERDRYRLVEAESFGYLVPEWSFGICHPIGPKVFVNFYRQGRDELFAAVLVHETTHGFMHRHRTPARLPVWANEGLADYLASVLFRNSPIDLDRRRMGLRFIRNNGNVDAILDMGYHDGSWPGPNRIGYNVGYLLVELMVRDRPQAFTDWVNAVKDGKDWEQALAEDFGVPRAKLVDTFVRYYRVND